MKKGIILSLISSFILCLTSCNLNIVDVDNPLNVDKWPYDESAVQPVDPFLKVKNITILNTDKYKEKLYYFNPWLNINYSIEYEDGTIRGIGAKITSSNPDVAEVMGRKLHIKKEEEFTLTLTCREFSTSLVINPVFYHTEENISIYDFVHNLNDYTDYTAYTLTGYITGWTIKQDKATIYGNYYLGTTKDAPKEECVHVHQSSEHPEALCFINGEWRYLGNKPEYLDFPYENYKIGDKVTVKGIKQTYKAEQQIRGIVLEHENALPTAIEITNPINSIGNGDFYKFDAKLDNERNDFSFKIIEGDAGTIDSLGNFYSDPSKTGSVTIRVSSDVVPTLFKDLTINVIDHKKEIIPATIEQVINDTSGNGSKLFLIKGKTLINGDHTYPYGNFIWTDGINSIISYGLTIGDKCINYINGKYVYHNLKNLTSDIVDVGSDIEYSAVVMRADWTNPNTGETTKQVVGYLVQ